MSIIKHVTLQKIVVHDFRYDPLKSHYSKWSRGRGMTSIEFFTFKGKSLRRAPDPIGVVLNTKFAQTRISTDLHNIPQRKCIMDHD